MRGLGIDPFQGVANRELQDGLPIGPLVGHPPTDGLASRPTSQASPSLDGLCKIRSITDMTALDRFSINPHSFETGISVRISYSYSNSEW